MESRPLVEAVDGEMMEDLRSEMPERACKLRSAGSICAALLLVALVPFRSGHVQLSAATQDTLQAFSWPWESSPKEVAKKAAPFLPPSLTPKDLLEDAQMMEAAVAPELNDLKTEAEFLQECSKAMEKHGNMALVAGLNFTGKKAWPPLNTNCLQAITACLTSTACSGEDTSIKNIRDTYPHIMGTSSLDMYIGRMDNSALMSRVQEEATGCSSSNFLHVIATVGNELAMLKEVEGWFTTYSTAFTTIDSLLVDAFTSMLAVMEMKSDQMVAGTKRKWFKVALKVLSLVSEALTIYSTGKKWQAFVNTGAGKEMANEAEAAGSMTKIAVHKDIWEEREKNAKDKQEIFEKQAKGQTATSGNVALYGSTISQTTNQMQSVYGCGYGAANCDYLPTQGFARTEGGLEAVSNEAEKDREMVASFVEIIGEVQMNIRDLMKTASFQQKMIAGDWGRLQAATALAGACSVSVQDLEVAILSAFGAMQWAALGVLMPIKYAIYWQRSYAADQTATNIGCYWNSGTGCSGGNSNWGDDGCWKVPTWENDQEAIVRNPGASPDTPTLNSLSFTDSDILDASVASCSATRYVWMSEIGASPAASQPPSSDFFSALAGAQGPIQTYVNPVFGTNFSANDAGGWEAFVSQCQYMPRIYVFTSNPTDWSEAPPSSVAVDCNIFGITLHTYAFPDCGTASQNDGGYCVSGRPFLYNFNQFFWIPPNPGHYATYNASEGVHACCMPWYNTPPAPSTGWNQSCQYAVCDCTGLQEVRGAHWATQPWVGKCTSLLISDEDDQKYTTEVMTYEELRSSLGCPWTELAKSLTGCQDYAQELEEQKAAANRSDFPSSCLSDDQCSPDDKCVGGTGIQDCSTCESIQCAGFSPGYSWMSSEYGVHNQNFIFSSNTYCSCNGDSTQGVGYCNTAADCKTSVMCIGGKSYVAQGCGTCESIECNNNQCCCNGNTGSGGSVGNGGR